MATRTVERRRAERRVAAEEDASARFHHGSESYFVEGEGLLSESLGGRPEPEADGAGLEATAALATPFRFSRMGPKGTGQQLGEANRQKIAQAMTVPGEAVGGIAAGFTYLGQFLDHDLTFDKRPLMEGVDLSPAEIDQFRSPTLDLDSLYGGGPAVTPEFYAPDGLHLKLGTSDAGTPATPDGFDLPRGTGASPREAVIPDPRNDENLAVAQTHLAFIRFHNRVVDTQTNPADSAATRFALARKIVTKHYQWVIRTDYLPKICTPAIVKDVFDHGRKAFEVNKPPTSMPTMPLEFSVAAFRMGHAMIRSQYSWNKVFEAATLGQLFQFAGLGGNLGGGNTLPFIWIADFRRLYNFGAPGINRPDLVVPAAKFNRAMRIDTRLANPLRVLPVVSDPAPRNNLAFRNLLRANMVKLATGQQMVTFLHGKSVSATKLTNAQIRDGKNGASLAALNTTQRSALVSKTPLWFYILREAEFNGGKLGQVGSRIVAETFHRAMQGSTHSIVRDTAFKPSLGPTNTTFRMVDLLLFAFEGQAALLNPNGV